MLTGSIATRGKTAFFENFTRACQCFVMVESSGRELQPFFCDILSFSMTKWSIFACCGGVDEHCSTRHTRASWFAKTDNVLRWITQGFKWGGFEWGGGGGLMTFVVDC